MLLKPKTKLKFTNDWLKQLKFKEHSDYDLAGHVSAIALKSESGSVFDFYRTNPLEKPENFKLTQLYYKIKEARNLVDYFDFIETTRVRIHKQEPGKQIPLHSDDNNVAAKDKDDLRLRMLTALTTSSDFVYQFEYKDKYQILSLDQGESIIFDPDRVKHGMMNNSKDKTRYCLVQIFKAYPQQQGLIEFIQKKRIITI